MNGSGVDRWRIGACAAFFIGNSVLAADLPDLEPLVIQAPARLTGLPHPTLTWVWGTTDPGAPVRFYRARTR
jgi:hypothetical protein